MNKVILIGNLANDPEGRTTQSGVSQSTFRIAVQRRLANAQGVRETDFLTVVAWRQTADFCNRYLAKGRKIAVEGTIQVRNYEKDGRKIYVTEIIADQIESLSPRGQQNAPDQEPPAETGSNEFTEVDDDELPFD